MHIYFIEFLVNRQLKNNEHIGSVISIGMLTNSIAGKWNHKLNDYYIEKVHTNILIKFA